MGGTGRAGEKERCDAPCLHSCEHTLVLLTCTLVCTLTRIPTHPHLPTHTEERRVRTLSRDLVPSPLGHIMSLMSGVT